jgi:TRAP-type C4-dicarboxylate transport system substrate-binding protein
MVALVQRACLALFLFIPIAREAVSGEPLANQFLDGLVAQTAPAFDPEVPLSLRFTSPAASTSPLIISWNESLGALMSATSGGIDIKTFHGGTVHGTGYGFKALRTGNADLATCYAATRLHTMPLSTVWSLPFVAPHRAVVGTRLALALQGEYFVPEYEKQGVHLVGQYVLPPTNLLSRRPIRSLEDLKGMRIAAVPTQAEALKALGADPVTIPFPEFYVALQRGMVDGVLWVDIAMVAYRLTEVAKHRTVVGLSGSSTDLCTAIRYKAAVPARAYETIHSFVRGMLFYSSIKTDRDWDSGLENAFNAHGVKSITLSSGEVKRWRKAVQPVIDQWIAKTEKQGKPARALLQDIEKLKSVYEPQTDQEIVSGMQKLIFQDSNQAKGAHYAR